MKLFKISTDYNYALADIAESYDATDSLILTSETTELLKNFRYDWITEDSTLIPNIAIIMSELFCLDEKAVTELRPYLSDLILSAILIRKDTFYSLSNIPILKGSLNLKSSKIKYFSTGDIMDVTKPVFNEQNYPSLFKTEELIGSFFCSEDLMNTITANNLTGILFEECKVKSKFW
ncbi:MAG: hypothetical protein K2G41_10870 [Duncaniella sp.]|uniref:hypothetical protein n=1 Tax=Duncaniella sp. TaxID=2518496 RepID=UPI0023D6CF78|nr:hypothetical protein [Duncaniella sp.]MDE6091187.1 hypothetical protein [Duncaniella sp.]